MKIIILNSRPGEVVIEDRRAPLRPQIKISAPFYTAYTLGGVALRNIADSLVALPGDQSSRDESYIREMNERTGKE